MSKSINYISHTPKPGDFVCAEQYMKGWNPSTIQTWGVYLYDSADDSSKYSAGNRLVICVGASDDPARPTFWKGFFRGQVAYDDMLDRGWGMQRLEKVEGIRQNLQMYIDKAKEQFS